MTTIKSKSTFALIWDALVILIVSLLLIEFIGVLRFKNTANAVMTKLGSLNNNALADIPHPPEVTLVTNSNILLYPPNDPSHIMYDARSEARYRIRGATPEYIADYYQKFFSSRGWRQDWQKDGAEVNGHYSYGFHKGKVCAAINFTPSDFTFDLGKFSSVIITVWHDFWVQTFSPFGIGKFLVELRYVVPNCPRKVN